MSTGALAPVDLKRNAALERINQMTQHASLRIDSVGKRHRNVLKRHERLHALIGNEEGKSTERESVYKLPKMKLIKLKVKKEKTAKEEAATAEGGATPQAGASPGQGAAPGQKGAASAQKPAASGQKPQAAEKSKGKEK
jgi:small basic protein (TIGR04137 family)